MRTFVPSLGISTCIEKKEGLIMILSLNCGSSSIKMDVFGENQASTLACFRIARLNTESPEFKCSPELKVSEFPRTLDSALELLLSETIKLFPEIKAVAHRVVHGGKDYSAPTLINDDVVNRIEELADLAPLHNPINAIGIRIARKLLPDVSHVAVFDTAFHSTLPRRARTYALPKELSAKHDIRRYGFHGTSHAYVAKQAALYLERPLQSLRLITCHLGNGASMAAIEYGSSVETSMGQTPLEGLVMGTRCGDIDPSIPLSLAKLEGLTLDEVDQVLNRRSGLLGLSGSSKDMRDIIESAATGDEDCQLALTVFCHRIRKYIGAYAAVMGGVDAIVFTGGIGENSSVIRHRVAQRLSFLGAQIDETRNREAKLDAQNNTEDISKRNSSVRILAISTDEQKAMAQESATLLDLLSANRKTAPIPVGVSSRHMHITQEALEQLFGPTHKLTPLKQLSQPGQFAANETVTLIGPKNKIENVRILGPLRSKNQIEISRTDEYTLGIDAPVRASGNVENTPGIKVIGPQGSIDLENGVICAWRHIHMRPEDAKSYCVENGDTVSVRLEQEERGLTFGNVLVRVSEKYALEMHIDTDEANAAEISTGALAYLVSPND